MTNQKYIYSKILNKYNNDLIHNLRDFNNRLKPITRLKKLIAHELAHTAGEMHHGREFRNALLSLVSVFMGSKAGKELKKEFKAKKLKLGSHPKPYTFERWSAAREKMAAMRTKL